MSGSRVSVSSAPLREQCLHAIRALIVSGGLAPGEIHSIGSLAERLGVSITPVREALLDLARDETIEMLRNRGFRVVALTDADLDELMELRIMLEVPAIGSIAAAQPPPDLSELRPLAEEITQHATTGDMVSFLARDRDLHLAVLALHGNDRLVRHVGQLRDQTRLYGLDAIAGSPELVRSAEEHEELLDLIEAGRSEEAAALMRRHLLHTRGLWSGRPSEEA